MSGGVDSSVAALILKNEGHDVMGITMDLWGKDVQVPEGVLSINSAVKDAAEVARKLGIEHKVVDLSREFSDEVKRYFASEYARGRTPNPCVVCNRRIKFGHLWDAARKLGAGSISTGHYARITGEKGHPTLTEAVDKKRDQSYFLYDIPRNMLMNIVFPLGSLSKDKVRRMAFEEGLPAAFREDSQDICFVNTDDDYKGFLLRLGVKAFEPGDIVDISGKNIGRHNGIASYTVGQRQGLGVAAAEPLYVLKIDPENNRIIVGHRRSTMKSRIKIGGLNWLIDDTEISFPLELEARIRYRSSKAKAILREDRGGDKALLEFLNGQFAPTPGQSAVFYRGENVLGGGWIEEVID